jgi:pimeloyl-ACP methyl ester carboxylesterase
LALCLHGFPDSAHTWRHLLPGLAEAGFHAVAPFLRGYAPTGSPTTAAMGSARWSPTPSACSPRARA